MNVLHCYRNIIYKESPESDRSKTGPRLQKQKRNYNKNFDNSRINRGYPLGIFLRKNTYFWEYFFKISTRGYPLKAWHGSLQHLCLPHMNAASDWNILKTSFKILPGKMGSRAIIISHFQEPLYYLYLTVWLLRQSRPGSDLIYSNITDPYSKKLEMKENDNYILDGTAIYYM